MFLVMFMSIYIHIPFCSSICTYCDFCKIIYNRKYIDDYLDNLEKEIRLRYKKENVKSIYIGGGTPSCLEDNELIKLFNIVKLFNVDENIEFTMECNVESITEEKLKIMSNYGVNRISIGVESFNDDIIKKLGRHHNKKMVFDKINLVKKYFNNINIDLIYAAYDDINILKDDIMSFLQLNIEHISTYSLILEDNTMLKINGMENINEDVDYEKDDFDVYMPVEYYEKNQSDMDIISKTDGGYAGGTKYFMPKDYVVEQIKGGMRKRVFNRVPVIFCQINYLDSGCKGIMLDKSENGIYTVLLA